MSSAFLPAPEIPANVEESRLATLRDMAVLDTDAEGEYDHIVAIVSRLLGTPIALVSLVDESRQWFKARVGLDAAETSREISFCGHAITSDEVFCIEDAQADDRFSGNPLVTNSPHIRFYLGAPLITQSGDRVGTLCAIDTEPRAASAEDIALIRAQARLVVSLLESRRQAKLLHEHSLELEAMATAVEASRDTLRDFTFALTHDLASPVRFVQEFGKRLNRRVPGLPELQRIMAAADRMQAMVSALRDYANVGNDLPTEAVDLSAAMDAVVRLLAPDIAGAGANVASSLSHNVVGHPVFLGQVLQNLVANALKYRSERSPEITCRSTETDGVIRVEVSDNGLGIEKRFHGEVFAPMRRLHGHGDIEGSGLGLALCKRAVENLGGTIGLTSELGVGTTVWFELPAA